MANRAVLAMPPAWTTCWKWCKGLTVVWCLALVGRFEWKMDKRKLLLEGHT